MIEDIIGGNPDDLLFGDPIPKAPNAQYLKEIVDKLDFIKM